MELSFYCEQCSKYYELYVNETIFELKELLLRCAIKYATLVNDILIQEHDDISDNS